MGGIQAHTAVAVPAQSGAHLHSGESRDTPGALCGFSCQLVRICWIQMLYRPESNGQLFGEDVRLVGWAKRETCPWGSHNNSCCCR